MPGHTSPPPPPPLLYHPHQKYCYEATLQTACMLQGIGVTPVYPMTFNPLTYICQCFQCHWDAVAQLEKKGKGFLPSSTKTVALPYLLPPPHLPQPLPLTITPVPPPAPPPPSPPFLSHALYWSISFLILFSSMSRREIPCSCSRSLTSTNTLSHDITWHHMTLYGKICRTSTHIHRGTRARTHMVRTLVKRLRNRTEPRTMTKKKYSQA